MFGGGTKLSKFAYVRIPNLANLLKTRISDKCDVMLYAASKEQLGRKKRVPIHLLTYSKAIDLLRFLFNFDAKGRTPMVTLFPNIFW